MSAPRVIGRYLLYDEIASGGMASVHFARMTGPHGFSRRIAIKKLHPQFCKDAEFVSMFLDEARLAARIQHPNVVPTLDVVASHGELFVVMEYVQGESLSRLLRHCSARAEPMPSSLAATIIAGVLHGLHAAHETTGLHGEALDVVHRDVSPQNILVGVDGAPRILDFGIAKAVGRAQTTRDGRLKGKLGYMAPEQLVGDVSRRTDVYAASIVLWEALTGQRLFSSDPAALSSRLAGGEAPRARSVASHVPQALDEILARGLRVDPAERFPTARAMAIALEEAAPLVAASVVGAWVESLAGPVLESRQEALAEIESASGRDASHTETEVVEEETASMTAGPSLAARTAPRGARTLGATPLLVLGLAGAAVIGAVATLLVTRSHAAARPGPEVPSEVSPESTASALASAAASTIVADEPPPAASPSTARVTAPPPRRPSPPSKPRGCDPPFRVDASGRKIPKPECF